MKTPVVSQRVPEPGQLAEVRGRRFVVADVRAGAHGDARRTHHLVSLTSVDDSSLGEELQVIWEVERGARAFEREQLPQPTSFDPADRLDAFLDAVRWGVISAMDPGTFHAPFRSGIDIEDYQLEPLVRAVQMPRVNLLIADAVGLGKTIEAGLIVQELLLRNRIRTVLVACPAGLQIQWQEEMRARFGLDFRIVDSALFARLRRDRGVNANPWGHFPRLITSYPFLRRERNLRLFRDLLPPDGRPAYPRTFDLLICDEAHNLAPSGPQARESQQTAAIRTLAPHFEHRLFLSATPHNGYTPSFTALLELLDDQRYVRGTEINQRHLHRITMVRRLRSDLAAREDGKPRFPVRKLIALEVEFPVEEREVHALLREYGDLRRAALGAGDRWAVEFLLKLLKKRLFSSPAAFHSSLQAHRRSLKTARPAGRRSSTMRLGILRRMVLGLDETPEDDDSYDEAWKESVEEATDGQPPLSPRETELLDRMIAWADRAMHAGDARGRRLVEWVREQVRPGEEWSDERVILFTEFRDTQNWLIGLLGNTGLAGSDRILRLYGGMPPDERERVKAAFQAEPRESPVRILVATDAAAEGINLQNHCHHLVHVEIPWNPNRLEQRNGRIDRHGQRHDPLIYHFVPKGYETRGVGAVGRPGDSLEADLEFLARAVRKVSQIREDLGKVGPVIARQVEEAMAGQRTHLDTAAAEREAEPARRLLQTDRSIRERVRELSAQFDEVRERLHITPENLRHVVQIGLDLAGQPPLSPEALGEATVFRAQALRGAWEACLAGLAHPYSGRLRPLTFDPDVARGNDNVVLVHLHHRLVQMCLRLLRAQIWSTGPEARLSRCTVRSVPAELLREPALVAYGRLLILGGTHRKLDEEIVTAGIWVREQTTERIGVKRVEELLAAAEPADPTDPTALALLDSWPRLDRRLRDALQARARELGQSAVRDLAERAAKEKAEVTARLEELRKILQQSLGQGEAPAQLTFETLVVDEERDRFADHLRRRIEAIPGEIEAEHGQIDRHYESPTERLFPIAVAFLIPVRPGRTPRGASG